MICPCCGSQVATQAHPAFERLATAANPPGQVARRALEVLIANFGEWVPMRRLVHAVYHDRIDGGSLAAKNTVSSMLSRQRRRIAALGLEVTGRPFSGYRVTWLGTPAPLAMSGAERTRKWRRRQTSPAIQPRQAA